MTHRAKTPFPSGLLAAVLSPAPYGRPAAASLYLSLSTDLLFWVLCMQTKRDLRVLWEAIMHWEPVAAVLESVCGFPQSSRSANTSLSSEFSLYIISLYFLLICDLKPLLLICCLHHRAATYKTSVFMHAIRLKYSRYINTHFHSWTSVQDVFFLND